MSVLRSSFCFLRPLAAAALVAACASSADAPRIDAANGSDVEVKSACPAGAVRCGGDGVKGKKGTLYRCDVGSVTAVQECPAACTTDATSKRGVCAATHDLADAKAFAAKFYGQQGPSLRGNESVEQLPDLTPELARQVGKKIVIPGDGAVFMCAQDRPTSTRVGEPTRDGEDALVPIDASFGGRHRSVILRVRLSDLKVAGWTCGMPFHTTAEAHEVVRNFYGAHGPYATDGSGYRDPDAMSSDLRQKIAGLPITAAKGDALTCSRDDRADAVSVDVPVETGDFASTVVRLVSGTKTTEVVVAVGLPDLKIHGTMCAPFDDGGVWMR